MVNAIVKEMVRPGMKVAGTCTCIVYICTYRYMLQDSSPLQDFSAMANLITCIQRAIQDLSQFGRLEQMLEINAEEWSWMTCYKSPIGMCLFNVLTLWYWEMQTYMYLDTLPFIPIVLPDGTVIAKKHNLAVPTSVLLEILQWEALGATTDDAIGRLRLKTVPQGYTPHQWSPGQYTCSFPQ